MQLLLRRLMHFSSLIRFVLSYFFLSVENVIVSITKLNECSPAGMIENHAVDSVAAVLGRIAHTAYIDSACCYQPSSVVCRSVTLVSPAKMAEAMVMLFWLRTPMGQRNHVSNGGPHTLHGKGQF